MPRVKSVKEGLVVVDNGVAVMTEGTAHLDRRLLSYARIWVYCDCRLLYRWAHSTLDLTTGLHSSKCCLIDPAYPVAWQSVLP